MSTSGSVDHSTSRDELIKYALLNVGGISKGVTPDSTDVTDTAYILNNIVKQWNVKLGMPLWALKTGYILPIADTNSMTVGSHCVTSYVQTTIGADEASGQTTLTVASITGISSGDVLGVELDDGSIHWTTVNGAPAAGEVVATDAITDDASEGNIVYAYTTTNRITRPLRVVHAYTHDESSEADTPVTIISHQEYADLGTKDSESYPTQLYYDPQLGTAATFYWYPRHIDGNKVITIRYHRPFEDFDAAADEPDFPQEWFFPLLWYLSWAMSGKYGVDVETRQQWLREAKILIDETEGGLMEEGSVFLQPSEQ